MDFKNKQTQYLVFFFSGIFIGTIAISVYSAPQASNETIEIKKLLNTIHETAKKPELRQKFSDQNQDTESILTEFLDDLIKVMIAFEQQEFTEPDLTPADEFIDKWSAIKDSCTDCIPFTPAFEKILQEVANRFPQQVKHNSPLTPFYEFFREMEALNWGGLGQLFSIPNFPRQHLTTVIFENKTVRVTPDGHKEFINERSILQALNGELKFVEHIKDDKVKGAYLAHNQMTILHNAYEELKATGAPEEVLTIWEQYIVLLNQELLDAFLNGDMDKKSYLSAMGILPTSSDIIRREHPLLDLPTNFEYEKIYQLYPVSD